MHHWDATYRSFVYASKNCHAKAPARAWEPDGPKPPGRRRRARDRSIDSLLAEELLGHSEPASPTQTPTSASRSGFMSSMSMPHASQRRLDSPKSARSHPRSRNFVVSYLSQLPVTSRTRGCQLQPETVFHGVEGLDQAAPERPGSAPQQGSQFRYVPDQPAEPQGSPRPPPPPQQPKGQFRYVPDRPEPESRPHSPSQPGGQNRYVPDQSTESRSTPTPPLPAGRGQLWRNCLPPPFKLDQTDDDGSCPSLSTASLMKDSSFAASALSSVTPRYISSKDSDAAQSGTTSRTLKLSLDDPFYLQAALGSRTPRAGSDERAVSKERTGSKARAGSKGNPINDLLTPAGVSRTPRACGSGSQADDAQPPAGASRTPRAESKERSPSKRRTLTAGGAREPAAKAPPRAPAATKPSAHANRRLKQKMQAFDRRHIQRLTRRQSDAASSHHENTSEPSRSHHGSAARLDRSPSETRRKGIVEVELPYRILRCSSQRAEAPAANLLMAGGCWETDAMQVSNEYVVLELLSQAEAAGQQKRKSFVAQGAPNCVTSVALSVSGTDVSPHRCHMHYSQESPDGPWKDAWSFDIPSKQQCTFKSLHDYSCAPCISEFNDAMARSCNGSVEEAWYHFFDVKRVGALTYPEFVSSCTRLRNYLAKNGQISSCLLDVQTLFEALDRGAGTLRFMDLQRHRPAQGKRPEAVWWRLTIQDNWGSKKGIQVVGPLVLGTTKCFPSVGSGLVLNRGPRDVDPITAFDLRTLGLDPTTVRLRRLAKKHGIPILEVEELHEIFRLGDTASAGSVDQQQFNQIVLELHGSQDLRDFPPGRLRSFWHLAATKSSRLDFESFVKWFKSNSNQIF